MLSEAEHTCSARESDTLQCPFSTEKIAKGVGGSLVRLSALAEG